MPLHLCWVRLPEMSRSTLIIGGCPPRSPRAIQAIMFIMSWGTWGICDSSNDPDQVGNRYITHAIISSHDPHQLIVIVSRKLLMSSSSPWKRFFWRHYFPAYSLTNLSVMHFTTRWPCIHASSYLAPSTSTESPIRVADKSRSRRRIKNVFIDDRGYPDQSNEFDILLHNIDGGPVLRKLKHPPPPMDSDDPMFMFSYNEALHSDRLRKDLNLSHLKVPLQQSIYALIHKKLVCLRRPWCFCPSTQL